MSDTGALDAAYASVDGLQIGLRGPVLHLVLDRPSKRNALDDTMVTGLIGAIDAAGRDERVRCIVLAGAGDHFCGGADLVVRNATPPTADGAAPRRPRVGSIQRRVPSLAHRLIPLVASVQVPVVCRVRGWAAGIGFHLALAADFTVVADDARLWEPFTERGFTPDSGGSWLVPRFVGTVRARELLLLGRALEGREAADWGVVHLAVPAERLDAEVAALVDRLSSGPTVALGLTKWLLAASPSASLDDQLQNEALALELSSRTDDFREGLAAFRDKRPPSFEGR
ncbi:MAG TPA: enoyl-CoA hydratase-related protein [Acidimicrobiales bacterium]|nr:enoyl-CoA hydratase-related protein [Acidimicrobiales bacterium]